MKRNTCKDTVTTGGEKGSSATVSVNSLSGQFGDGTVFFSAGCSMMIAGSILLLWTLLTSTSTEAVVLQRYSLRVALSALFLAAVMSVSAASLLSRVFRQKLQSRLNGIPGWLAAMMVLLPVPAVFLLWFLIQPAVLGRLPGFLGASLLFTSPGVTLMGSYSSNRFREARTGLFAALVILVPGALLVEIAAVNMLPGSIFNPRLGLVPNQNFVLNVDLPGISPEGRLTTNSWGIRGDEPPHEWDEYITVVAVGGSTTICYYLDDEKTWPAIMQRRIEGEGAEVWVGNAGIPCHSVSEHILMLEELVSRVRPDITVFLVGANELAHFWGGEAAVNRNPLGTGGLRSWFFEKSRILQLLHRAKIVWLDGAMVVRPTVNEEREIIRQRLATPLTLPEPELPENLLEILPDPSAYSQDIMRLISICREIGTTPVFLTQPHLWENSPHWRGIHGAAIAGAPDMAYSAATISLFLDALNRQTMDVCSREGVIVYDLASAIPRSSALFYDEMHFTEKGAMLVAMKTAEFLLDSSLLERLSEQESFSLYD